MTPDEYDYLRNLLRRRSGLVLTDDKRYLLESRLSPIARRIGAADLSDLVRRLQATPSEGLVAEIVETMTTNESFFFRDKAPFEHFRDFIMPELLSKRQSERRIRIWCAAAATGQEPYSVALFLSEMGNKLAGWEIEILATDLSTEVLERARSGFFSHFEVQRGLPIQLLLKYFSKAGDEWQIAPQIRAMVEFRPFNLLDDFSCLGVFDVVICRNVLLYFGPDNKKNVLERLATSTAPDGFLMLGAAESVLGLSQRFRPLPNTRCLFARSNAAAFASATVVPFTPRRAAAGRG
ncbi:MAG TPA: protein-glutamate O-methyltransferase CheR [Xanthobacteraceae bacterium]